MATKKVVKEVKKVKKAKEVVEPVIVREIPNDCPDCNYGLTRGGLPCPTCNGTGRR
jgi:hypothetical protein